MPVVPDKHVTTTEVRAWQGLHLLHAAGSLSSRKVELLLAAKGLSFNSRPVAMMSDSTHGARGQWYLGINPRGLVPTLVHNGTVLIESNDILVYLAQQVIRVTIRDSCDRVAPFAACAGVPLAWGSGVTDSRLQRHLGQTGTGLVDAHAQHTQCPNSTM